MSTALPARIQSFNEEFANALSHGIALASAVVAVPWLIIYTAGTNSALAIVGVCVFGLTVILMYLTSMLYHALPVGDTKRFFRMLDHSSIYLLIAGTYTPFTLGVLRGPWGWTLLIIIWSLAITGIALKARKGIRDGHLSTVLYILMGWLVVVAIVPLWMNMSTPGLVWLIAGGLAYTGGTVFYAAPRLPFAHLIWHLFVITGTACHFVAVSFYAAA